jgi:transglutaminase-like putative cysteine protease
MISERVGRHSPDGGSDTASNASLSDMASTVSLSMVTIAAAAGMGRLFEDGSYLAPLVVAALVAHGLAWSSRRWGVSLLATAGSAMVVLALVTIWVVLPDTTWHALPGLGTLDAVLRELRQARELFSEVVAPAPVTRGFLMASMLGVGMTAFLADWAAFRLESLFEAVLPSFLLVVFTAFLGADRDRAVLVLLYLAAVAVFLLIHPSWLQRSTIPWLAGRAKGELSWRLPTGATLGGAAVMAGLLVGTSLAGADGPSDLWRGRSGRQQTTVSPLVDIRGRLVSQSDAEVFSVRSSAPAYWRLTSLDTFDGQIWSSDARHVSVSGRLPAEPGGDSTGERVTQEFTIASLSSTWLPAAYRPRRVAGVPGLRYNDQLGSLIGDEQTRQGLTYRVTSSVPRLGAEELSQAPPARDLPDLDAFLRLPSVSPRVRQLATQLTSASPSPFEKALALQTFFREGFTYDLSARPGHDRRALEGFLFRDRSGYCEQFAGAYAVLARAAGLPTRVAVGFTPGEMADDGRYHVRGLNAHAWPEVYMAGSGWVAFEPTPGRGAPGASYTGVAEAQARPDDPTTATTAAPTATTVTPPTTEPLSPEEVAEASDSEAGGRSALVWVGMALLVAGVLALLLAAIPAAKRARRQRRRRTATTAGDRVLVAWAEAAEALAQAGVPRRADETLDEHATRAVGAGGLPQPAATALADLVGAAAAASYRAEPVEGRVATAATAAAATVEKAVSEQASRPERLRRAVDPRPLMWG